MSLSDVCCDQKGVDLWCWMWQKAYSLLKVFESLKNGSVREMNDYASASFVHTARSFSVVVKGPTGAVCHVFPLIKISRDSAELDTLHEQQRLLLIRKDSCFDSHFVVDVWLFFYFALYYCSANFYFPLYYFCIDYFYFALFIIAVFVLIFYFAL